MNADQHQLAAEWFERLLALEARARQEQLATLRASDAALADLLAELLEEDGAQQRLDRPAAELFARAPLDRTPRHEPPTQIGRYRLLGRLGGGGMGVVYEAEQDQPRRKVALKLLRGALLDARAQRRFEYEAEVLGLLNHPGIARIYEAGSALVGDELQPFFAMELVRGQPLDQYAERAQLDRRARVELIATLCDALEHAHRRGVIHRDLKPTNVLVDERGAPKVLDFGVARVSSRSDAFQTLAGELLGTPAYMSPEQIEGDPAAVDARADVYALGVLAFELLARRKLHDLGGLSVRDAVQRVLDSEAPPLGAIDRALRGDLETIVAKALERDVERRYGSAQELAADLRRWLADEPIAARPPSTVYQLGKFARRHRALVGGVAAVFVAMGVGLAVSWTQYLRAESSRAAERIARIEAEDASAELSETTDYFLDLLQSPMPEYGGADVRVMDVLERARPRVDRAFLGRPLQRARLLSTLSRVHHGVGDYASALEFAREAFELVDASASAERGERIDALQNFATSAAQVGELEQGLEAIEKAVALLEEGDHALRRATVHGTHARILLALRRVDAAQQAAAGTAAALEQSPGLSAAEAAPEELTIVQVLRGAGRLDEAREVCLASIERQTRESPEVTFALVCCFDEMGAIEFRAERYDESAQWLRKSLARLRELVAEDHPTIATHLGNLGAVLRLQGKLDEATPLFEEALQLARKHLAPTDPSLAVKITNHALLLRDRREFAQAEELLREALAVFTDASGPSQQRAYVRYQLGSVLIDLEQFAEACEVLAPSLEEQLQIFAPSRPEAVAVASALARAQLGAQRPREAVATLRALLDALEAAGPREGTWTDAAIALAGAHLDLGEVAAARELLGQIDAVHADQPDPALDARVRATRGLAHALAGELDAARPLLENAEREHVELLGADHALTLQLRDRLERIYAPLVRH